MGMDIEKVVSNDSDVVVFLKVTYQNLVARAVHHFCRTGWITDRI